MYSPVFTTTALCSLAVLALSACQKANSSARYGYYNAPDCAYQQACGTYAPQPVYWAPAPVQTYAPAAHNYTVVTTETVETPSDITPYVPAPIDNCPAGSVLQDDGTCEASASFELPQYEPPVIGIYPEPIIQPDFRPVRK